MKATLKFLRIKVKICQAQDQKILQDLLGGAFGRVQNFCERHRAVR